MLQSIPLTCYSHSLFFLPFSVDEANVVMRITVPLNLVVPDSFPPICSTIQVTRKVSAGFYEAVFS
jgi:hypothetical protein